MSQISRDEVAHLARLARLALTDDELDGFAGQRGAILEHVSQIRAVDVTDVEATDSPLKSVNVTRPDVVEPGLSQEEALAQAPESAEGRFQLELVKGGDGWWRGWFTSPKKPNGFVAVRASAAMTSGYSISQEIIRAYGLR